MKNHCAAHSILRCYCTYQNTCMNNMRFEGTQIKPPTTKCIFNDIANFVEMCNIPSFYLLNSFVFPSSSSFSFSSVSNSNRSVEKNWHVR